jgi:hypothetical protein
MIFISFFFPFLYERLEGNSIFPETPAQVPADPEDQVRMVE